MFNIKKLHIIFLFIFLVFSCPQEEPGNNNGNGNGNKNGNGNGNGKLKVGDIVDGWKLVWHDEFETDTLDDTKWNIDLGTGQQYGLAGWGNNEEQWYHQQCVTVVDGKLNLEARRVGTQYRSGKVTTGMTRNTSGDEFPPKFTLNMGKVEASIKSPRGAGFWPAFWMLGQNPDDYWPRCGEIDIMEIRGGQENRYGVAVHYLANQGRYTSPGHQWTGGNKQNINSPNLADDFHVYGVIWDTDSIRFYHNNELFHTSNINSLPGGLANPDAFSHPAGFSIILNVAIGGNYIGNVLPSDEVITGPIENRSLQVDWVRAWEKAD